MKLFVILTIVFIRESQSEWKLIWNEEFDSEIIDSNEWEIENELNSCEGKKFYFLLIQDCRLEFKF